MSRRQKLSWSIGIVVLLVMAIAVTGYGQAQTKQETKAPAFQYPERPIEVIVPFAAGGGTDVACRILKPFAEKELGVPLVITNKPGAGGDIGLAEIALSKPDGYTIGFFNLPSGLVGVIERPDQVRFTLDSFETICTQTATTRLFAVRKDSPFKTFEDLLKYAEDNPGRLMAGSGGHGGFAHLTLLGLRKATGVDITLVPLTGGSETVAQCLGGQIDVAPLSTSEARASVEAGELRPLVILSDERNANYPDVPTTKELGIDLFMIGYQGVVAPKGTPPDIIKTLQDAFLRAMENPEYKEKLAQSGNEHWPSDGEKFREYIQDLYEVVKELLSSL